MKTKVPVVKAIKTPSSYIHPDAPYEMLPKHEFSMALIVSTFIFDFYNTIPDFVDACTIED